MNLQELINTAKELANTIIESELYQNTETENQANEILKITEFSIDNLITEYYFSTKRIALLWGIDDVIGRAKELDICINEDEAFIILQKVDHRHDASIGVNWEVLDVYIEYYLISKK